jgi:hypothetical protein
VGSELTLAPAQHQTAGHRSAQCTAAAAAPHAQERRRIEPAQRQRSHQR